MISHNSCKTYLSKWFGLKSLNSAFFCNSEKDDAKYILRLVIVDGILEEKIFKQVNYAIGKI